MSIVIVSMIMKYRSNVHVFAGMSTLLTCKCCRCMYVYRTIARCVATGLCELIVQGPEITILIIGKPNNNYPKYSTYIFMCVQ